MNPNNNKNFNDEALRINRELKRENDKLKYRITELEEKLLWFEDNNAHLVEDDESTDTSEILYQDWKEQDAYADKGMSRSDFIDKEYT